MPVWRNFFLGNEVRKGPRMDIEFMRKTTKKEPARHGHRPARRRAAHRHPCPVASGSAWRSPGRCTSGEGPHPRRAHRGAGVKQSGVVLRYIIQARERGLGVIFITHNPHHAYPVGDRFLLLKRGRSIGYYPKDEVTRDELTALMAGGAELEELSHELAGGGGAAAEAAHVLKEEAHELGIGSDKPGGGE
jgi:simple sugar transport system ATP-binding protein